MSLRIAFTNFYDTRSLRAWSGIPNFIWQTLERRGIPVEIHGPFSYQPSLKDRLWAAFAWRLFRKNYTHIITRNYVRQLASRVDASLAGSEANLILTTDGFFSPSLQSQLPIVEWTDVTTYNMFNYYWYYSRLMPWQERLGDTLQRERLERQELCIYSSEWAANAALEHYGQPREKVAVVPYGANLICQRNEADIENFITSRKKETCRLLFVGKIWDRKGADIAIAVTKQLNESGTPTRLTIVGSEPPPGETLPDCVELTGFIDKRNEAGRRRFEKLFEDSHFLILPSRAEGFGIVFCEAASFGLPSLANRTGGIPSAIVEGQSGYTFPIEGQGGKANPKATKGPQASGSDWLPGTLPYPISIDAPLINSYVGKIQHLMQNPAEYAALSRNAFRTYQQTHNYDKAIDRVLELIEERIGLTV